MVGGSSTGRRRLEDQRVILGPPFRSSWAPDEFAYRVPEGHVLVSLETDRRSDNRPGGSVLVPGDQIVGRAWARFYPLGDRRLLP